MGSFDPLHIHWAVSNYLSILFSILFLNVSFTLIRNIIFLIQNVAGYG